MRRFFPLALCAAFALTAFAPARLGEGHITLSNESSVTIALVHASTCDEDTWGEDLLPTDILEPGSEAVITVTDGCWDFKATTAEGQEFEHFGIDVATGDEIAWTITD